MTLMKMTTFVHHGLGLIWITVRQKKNHARDAVHLVQAPPDKPFRSISFSVPLRQDEDTDCLSWFLR